MTIVLVGGSNSIGTHLAHKLLALGDTVIVVDINPPFFTHKNLFFIQFDLQKQLPFNVLEQTDAVINLIGINSSLKYDDVLLRDSKNIITSTTHIVESIEKTVNRPSVYINTSSVQYYGTRDSEELNEKSLKGEGQMTEIVEEWENEAHKAESLGARVVCIRSAPILNKKKILSMFRRSNKFGRVFRLNEKNFWQPWIHEEDLVNAYIFALQTSTLQGVINAVSPDPVKYDSFMDLMATSFNKKSAKMNSSFLKKLFFKRNNLCSTNSQKIIPSKIIDKGFIFTYPTLVSVFEAIKNEKNR